MTRHDLLVEVTKKALAGLPVGGDSVLACMIVLHTHNLILNASCTLEDMEPLAEKRLHAITRRHAAEVVASALGNQDQDSGVEYWYARYVSNTPFEVAESVPEPMLSKMRMAKDEMVKHPLVREITEEE
jgi:hypothetical protein